MSSRPRASLAGAPGGATPLLAVRDLRVHFSVRSGLLGRRRPVLKAVDGVSFELRSGETLGLVGESGSGKSTLGRAILRLLPSAGGEVLWRGEDLARLSPAAMRRTRREMQIVFQDPLASLDPRMTAGEIVAEPLTAFEPELSARAVRAQVRAMLDEVGLLPEQMGRYPHELSAGQCQRVGIARAMINRPALIVCDEPVSALDVSIQAQILGLLLDLQAEHQISLLFISHNLAVVRHLSHRILVLYLGRVMELADREQLYRSPRHPYTQALIAAVPIPDPEIEQARHRIVLRGEPPSPIAPPSGCVFRTRCPKATPLCARRIPPLETIAPDHAVACHHWRD